MCEYNISQTDISSCFSLYLLQIDSLKGVQGDKHVNKEQIQNQKLYVISTQSSVKSSSIFLSKTWSLIRI